tara:strand:- start:159 stop:266 length:108 start_codon:yes stop_codon:yes gene_type:complete
MISLKEQRQSSESLAPVMFLARPSGLEPETLSLEG